MGLSPLLPHDVVPERLRRTRVPKHAMSEQDRMMARPAEFAGTARALSANGCWQDWNSPLPTAHDGQVRAGHPVLARGSRTHPFRLLVAHAVAQPRSALPGNTPSTGANPKARARQWTWIPCGSVTWSMRCWRLPCRPSRMLEALAAPPRPLLPPPSSAPVTGLPRIGKRSSRCRQPCFGTYAWRRLSSWPSRPCPGRWRPTRAKPATVNFCSATRRPRRGTSPGTVRVPSPSRHRAADPRPHRPIGSRR